MEDAVRIVDEAVDFTMFAWLRLEKRGIVRCRTPGSRREITDGGKYFTATNEPVAPDIACTTWGFSLSTTGEANL
jgi:hypothetical protein